MAGAAGSGGTGRPARLSATELIDAVVDPGSWRSWDEPVADPPGLDPAYAADLARARELTGLGEAVLTGAGRLRGRQVAVVSPLNRDRDGAVAWLRLTRPFAAASEGWTVSNGLRHA